MRNLFPPEVGMSQVRGVVNIINGSNGTISISKLAEEAEEDVDDLLPLLEACELLGFAKVSDSIIKITEKGARLSTSPHRRIIRESLVKLEPFKSTIKVLSKKSMATSDLLNYLRSRGVFLHEEEPVNYALLKKMLRNWGVRSKLLIYDEENDIWSMRV